MVPDLRNHQFLDTHGEKRRTPPGGYPAALRKRDAIGLRFQGVTALFTFILAGTDLQFHLLAQCAGNKASDGMRLPAGRLHQFLQGGTARPFQEFEYLGRLAPVSRRDYEVLARTGGLFHWGGLLARLSLRRRS